MSVQYRRPARACGPRYRAGACALRYIRNHIIKEQCLMNTSTNTTSARSPSTAAPQQLRDRAETGAKQSKEAFEKIGAATTEAAEAMTNCCSTALKGMQEYNSKVAEFTQT